VIQNNYCNCCEPPGNGDEPPPPPIPAFSYFLVIMGLVAAIYAVSVLKQTRRDLDF